MSQSREKLVTDERTDGRTDERTDGRTDGRTNGHSLLATLRKQSFIKVC